MSSMSDSNIGSGRWCAQRLNPSCRHTGRAAPAADSAPKIRSTTMRFLDNFTRSSSTLDPDVTRTASVKDKQISVPQGRSRTASSDRHRRVRSRGKIRRRAAARFAHRLGVPLTFFIPRQAPLGKTSSLDFTVPGQLHILRAALVGGLKNLHVGIRNLNNAFIFSTFRS